MESYLKLEKNKVVQVQPYFEEGFIKVNKKVIAGSILENGKYKECTHIKLNLTNDAYIEDVAAVTIENNTKHNSKLDKDIEKIERKSDRALRELALNPANVNAKALVQKAEDDIIVLRSQRK